MKLKIEKLECTTLSVLPKLPKRERMHLIEGVGPTGVNWEFFLTKDRFEHAKRVSHGQVLELAYNVRHVMQDKNAFVFQGIRADGHKEGLSYIGYPPRRYDEHGNVLTPKEGEMFFVFVTEERIIYTWRWELILPTKADQLLADRFLRRVR